MVSNMRANFTSDIAKDKVSFKDDIRSNWVEDEDGNELLDICYIQVYNSEGGLDAKIKLPINLGMSKKLTSTAELGIDVVGLRGGTLSENSYLKLDTSNRTYELVCGDIEPVILTTGIRVVTLNTINLMMTRPHSKHGYTYKVNRLLLKSYLSVLTMSIRNGEIDMTDINEYLRVFFSSTMDMDDVRDEKSRRRFTGVYKVDRSMYRRNKSVENPAYSIVISDTPVRFATLIGMCILDRIYLKVDFLDETDTLRYSDKYNAFVKSLKKEDKRNVKVILDVLSVRCIKRAYTDSVEFIEGEIND